MKQLILTADDYGIAPWTNEAIARLAETGILRRISVMPNMPFWREGLDSIRIRFPHLSLGLHFCLTSGRSVLPPEKIPLLVDSDGRFMLGFTGLLRRLHGRNRSEMLRQIWLELHAQIKKMEEVGFPPQHLDSHQHIHMIPPIYSLLIAQDSDKGAVPLRHSRERFPGFRRFRRRGRTWFPAGWAKWGVLSFCAMLARERQSRPGTSFPKTGYFGILDSGRMDRTAWRALLEDFPEDPCEVNTHPGLPPHAVSAWRETPLCCSDEDREFLRSPWRRIEYEAVSEPAFRHMLRYHEIDIAISDSAFPTKPGAHCKAS
jgi:hypothetical protein